KVEHGNPPRRSVLPDRPSHDCSCSGSAGLQCPVASQISPRDDSGLLTPRQVQRRDRYPRWPADRGLRISLQNRRRMSLATAFSPMLIVPCYTAPIFSTEELTMPSVLVLSGPNHGFDQ